jgi:hypothetical protein
MRVLVVCRGHRQLLLPAVGLVEIFEGRHPVNRPLFVAGQRRVERDLLLEEVRFGDLLAGIDAVGSHFCSSFSARS